MLRFCPLQNYSSGIMDQIFLTAGTSSNSKSARRHHVDRVKDKHLKKVDFGWMGFYNQRALCVRIVCPPDSKDQIDYVKFITREDNSYRGPAFEWVPSFGYCTLDEFYDHVKSELSGFDWPELAGDFWDRVNAYIEWLSYRYERFDGIDQWTHADVTDEEMDKKLAELSSDNFNFKEVKASMHDLFSGIPADAILSFLKEIAQRSYIAALDVALKTDFQDGEAKDWMKELVSKLLLSDELSDWTVKYSAPSHCARTNSYFEAIHGDIGDEETVDEFDSSFVCPINHSGASDFTSINITSSDEHSGYVVPDFFIALPEFPGVFPLVVEMEPSYQGNEGEFRNVRQMLTKMFYQDVIFGLVISPRGYRLSIIRKNNGSLYYTTTQIQYFIHQASSLGGKLDVTKLNKMISFIYGILKWTRITKCALSGSG